MDSEDWARRSDVFSYVLKVKGELASIEDLDVWNVKYRRNGERVGGHNEFILMSLVTWTTPYSELLDNAGNRLPLPVHLTM